MLAETARNSLGAQAVAFFYSERQEKCRLVSESTQNFGQKRKGGYTVDIVIAEKDYTLTLIDRPKNPLNRIMHSTNQEGVGQSSQPRI